MCTYHNSAISGNRRLFRGQIPGHDSASLGNACVRFRVIIVVLSYEHFLLRWCFRHGAVRYPYLHIPVAILEFPTFQSFLEYFRIQFVDGVREHFCTRPSRGGLLDFRLSLPPSLPPSHSSRSNVYPYLSLLLRRQPQSGGARAASEASARATTRCQEAV